MKKPLIQIGRKELVSFPDLGLEGVKAKVDTGAYRSSVHCTRLKEVMREGKPVLMVRFLDKTHPNYQKDGVLFPDFRNVKVKSSNGLVEDRYLVKTRIKIGRRILRTEFTLTNRSEMKNPVLLGRKLLSGRFLVDVSTAYKLKKS